MEGCKIKKFDYPFINHEEAAKFCRMKDMKCVASVMPRLNMRIAKAQKKTLKMLQSEMNKSLGPGWFQELSKNQIAAANLLFTAVAPDGIHCQLKRVIPVLNGINIYPLPQQHQLVAALKFAQGSDLAFLWFLYDRIYRTFNDVCTQKSYTLNERLILSCICHLDMLLTLRALEKILPKAEKHEKKIEVKTLKMKCEEKSYETPYDLPLPRPKLPQKEIIKRPKRTQPKFEIYEMYRDPYYVIENEANRWFASSSLMPSEAECISQRIIQDQIDDIQNVEKKPKNLCLRHADESSPFYKMMQKVLNDGEEIEQKENLAHLNSFERGIVQGIKIELSMAEKEARNEEENNQKLIIVKTVLRQIIESAVDLRFIHFCDKCEECLKSREIYDEIIQEQPKVSENSSKTSIASSIIQYCHRPSQFAQLTFDYEKIFATGFLEDHGAVKNSINTALKLEKHLTENNAITVCLRDMWQLEMRLWNEKRQADVVDRQQKVVGEVDKVWGNRRKILKLLEEAIGILRRNPKFVLAALPNSHRLPILREWILQKYGVEHTDEEERRKFKINKEQRQILMSRGVVPRIKVPTYEKFGIKRPIMTFDEVLKLRKKRDKWVKKYEAKLSNGCVDRVRILNATMENYLCNFESMRNIFYAYLPGIHNQLDQHIMNENIF